MDHSCTYSPEDDKLRITPACRLDKDEYERVKAAGYRWAPMQKVFYAVWSPAAEDIALEMCGEIEDEDKSLVSRAEERAERFEDYSENRKKEADQAHAAVAAIADNIPLGQPILVGHHSEKHARKDAERIENGMRKAVNAWKTSEYWKYRAAGALAHAKYKELPQVRARRIKTLKAALRQQICRYTPLVTKDRPEPMYFTQQRWDADREAPAIPHVWTGPAGRGGTWTAVEDLPKIKAACARYEEHLMHRLEYEHAMLEEQGGEKLLERKPKSAAAQLHLCNYRAPKGIDIPNQWSRGEMMHFGQIEMAQAEYAKIHNDYKGTRLVGNSHRVRICIRAHAWSCVFLTDSKIHDRPADVDAKPREPRPIPTYMPKAKDPDAEKFEALQQTLQAGVQVVSANQLFPTPKELVERMISEAEIEAGQRILEPSVGTGNIAEAIYSTAPVHIVAIEHSFNVLRMFEGRYKSWNNSRIDARHCDFLDCKPNLCKDHEGCDSDLGTFDRVLMNPPFENGADIKHILHALTFLKPSGRLVAICANGSRQNEKLKPLADSWEELPAGTFTGTNVRSVLLVINKPGNNAVTDKVEVSMSDRGGKAAPLLAETPSEAQRLAYSGRSWPSLRESRQFDRERLQVSPLFERKLF